MDPRNKEALLESIQKYRGTVKLLAGNLNKKITYEDGRYTIDGKRIPYGVMDCPLCGWFYFYTNCTGCCISADMCSPFCRGTPYLHYEGLLERAKRVTPDLIDAAQAELDYLEDLYGRRLYG